MMKVFIFHEDIMAIFVNLTLSCMGDFTDPYCMEWGRCTPSPPPTTYNESGIIRFLCMHNTHSLPLNFLLGLKGLKILPLLKFQVKMFRYWLPEDFFE